MALAYTDMELLSHTLQQSEVLDIDGLASLLGVSPDSIRSFRSRNPLGVPPPFMVRPHLRWRRETVIKWMEAREREESERIRRLFQPSVRARQGRARA